MLRRLPKSPEHISEYKKAISAPPGSEAWIIWRVNVCMNNFNRFNRDEALDGASMMDWVSNLEQLPGPLVAWAFDEYHRTGKYPPVIANICDLATKRRAELSGSLPKPKAPPPYDPATDAEIAKRQEIMRRAAAALSDSAPIQRAIEAVSDATGMPVTTIKGDSRTNIECRARWMAMHLARAATGRSVNQIAAVFRKDHSTVLHGLSRAEELLEGCPPFQRTYQTAERIVEDFKRGGRA